MGIATLFALATLMLAISTAAERLVAIVKTLWPWLATEQQDATGKVMASDRWRQLVVLLIAFVSAWITAAFVADSFPNGGIGTITLPGELKLPTVVIGLLATGGSAFWASILGWAKAVKDIKKENTLAARAIRVTAEADARAHLDRVPPGPVKV